MSEKKKVGDRLNLKLSLTDGNPNKFVRAYLRNQAGAIQSPAEVNLPHIEKGIYGESTLQMPNENQLLVIYRVFSDAGFTIIDQNYSQALDLFSRDDLDLRALVPTPYGVMAEIENGNPTVMVENNVVLADIENESAVSAIIEQGEVNALFQNIQEIEGVLND